MAIESTVIGASYLIAGGFIALAVLQQYKRLKAKYFSGGVRKEDVKPTNSRRAQHKTNRACDVLYRSPDILLIRVRGDSLGNRSTITTKYDSSNHRNCPRCGESIRVDLREDLLT